MSRSVRISSTLLLALPMLLALPACQQKQEELEPFRPRVKPDYSRELPPGALALRKIDPSQYPDFSRAYGDRASLIEAARHSLAYLAKPSSQKYFPYGDISHARAVRSLEEFLRLLERVQSPAQLDAELRTRFDVYQSVGYDDRGTVFFTGYYKPIFDGRKQRDSVFRYPLYRQPRDLAKDPEGRTLGRLGPDGRVVAAYHSREEIESGGVLRGQELAWLRDPFEAYVITVQGSARLRLEDGTLWELGYAGNNGHEYASIARVMIDDGAISRDELSLQGMLRYFRENPHKIAHYTRLNPRTVFFKETRGGPFGSINVPVTPFRSIATDKSVFPRACLAFMDTTLPTPSGPRPYAAFALDQDTGGAIRAAGRCDIYMGVGPGAEPTAGRTGAEGRLYYLFIREDASDNGAVASVR